MASEITRTELSKISLTDDLEIYVNRIDVVIEGDEVTQKSYAEVREYIPSLDLLGRGIVLPPQSIATVIEGLQEWQY